MRSKLDFTLIGSAFIGLALIFVRQISIEFRLGTHIDTHPVLTLILLLLFAGLVWIGVFVYLRRCAASAGIGYVKRSAMLAVVIGVALRAVFLGSTPIYEDDWNRYLWDGAVITQGVSPYSHSPDAITKHAGQNAELETLKALSRDNDNFLRRLNNPALTTIYPPVAQSVFALAAWIKPFSLDALRALYLISELLAMLLLIKALSVFGRSKIWVWLYALNPILIFTAFNGAHMDVLLVPFILGALILVKTRPLLSALCLAGAAGVKLWPLILGPVLFRAYNRKPLRYIGYGAALGAAAAFICAPMILQLGQVSGLQAYSATWQRSSFIFPMLSEGLSQLTPSGDMIARLLVAFIVGVAALWLGLKRHAHEAQIPLAMLAVLLVFFLLSPTGFPWYVIWFAFLLPWVPSYGAAILCVTVSLYYARFWYGEGGRYDIYLNWLVPIQFGVPILIILFELIRGRRHGRL